MCSSVTVDGGAGLIGVLLIKQKQQQLYALLVTNRQATTFDMSFLNLPLFVCVGLVTIEFQTRELLTLPFKMVAHTLFYQYAE